MKLVAADFRVLGTSLLSSFAMIAAGAAAVHFSIDANAKAKQELASAQSARNEIGRAHV